MATTAAPYGFMPVHKLDGSPLGPIREVPMTANSAAALAAGDLVAVVAGTAARVGTAPAAGTLSANSPNGVCVGVRYTDPTLKQEMHGQYLPANAVNSGYTNIWVKIVDDPATVFKIQADANTNLTDRTKIGFNATVDLSAGVNSTTGRSKAALIATSVATTGTLPLRIIDIADPASANTYPDVYVTYVFGTHAYQLAAGH